MSNLGDFSLGTTFDAKFTTRRFSTGAPFTLSGAPGIAAYPDNSTAENTSGITLSVDFDGRTGLNNIRVVATGGNGYAAGSSYHLVITSGTVDSVSVVGEVVGYFTLERGAAFVRLGAPAGASVSADIASVKSDTSGTQSDTNDIQARLPAALVSGRMDSSVGAIAAGAITATAIADGAFTAAKFAAGAFDAVWTVATRTLTSFGTLVADVATAVWAAAARTLTAFSGFTINTEVSDIKAKTDNLPPDPADASDIAAAFAAVPAAVWGFGSRTLTSFGTLVADIWAGVTTAFYAKFFTQDSGETYASSVAGSVVKEIADNAGSGTNDVNVITIGGLVQPVIKLVRSSRTIVLGTVGAAATTTVIPTSALDPAAAIIGQFNGRVVIFDETTATTTLRGCAATIETSAADGTLTLLAAEVLPAAPASGDTFVIV